MNLKQLSIAADVPETTLSSWLNRGLIPGLKGSRHERGGGRRFELAECLLVLLFAQYSRQGVSNRKLGERAVAASKVAWGVLGEVLHGDRSSGPVLIVTPLDDVGNEDRVIADDAAEAAEVVRQQLELGHVPVLLPLAPVLNRLAYHWAASVGVDVSSMPEPDLPSQNADATDDASHATDALARIVSEPGHG
ncbi:MAG: hypothetical protein WAS21_09250 [Geminicoccaceae bacterium]